MSEFNSEPIDIVVPWVNPNDESWKKEFNYWKEKETGIKDACRYNDWGFIKYVLRSIESNCPWCRYVFLILSSPTQIPEWLNTNCSKLKIVYHKDYIPNEFLPTFNSNVIEMFYPNISELSENYILINDDMFFWNKKHETFFFKNNIPVIYPSERTIRRNNCWEKTIDYTLKISNNLLNRNDKTISYTSHLAVSYKKSLNLFIISKLKKILKNSFEHTKFRNDNNLMHFLFNNIQVRLNKVINNKECRGQFILLTNNYISIKRGMALICLNECEKTKNDNIKNAIKILQNRFPNKSNFEI